MAVGLSCRTREAAQQTPNHVGQGEGRHRAARANACEGAGAVYLFQQKRSVREVPLCGTRRVEEVHDVAEQYVDLGLGVAVGACELPAPIRRDDRHAVQAEGLVSAAQVDLDEGALPANEREERRDGALGLALLLQRLKVHLARGPADGAEHLAEAVAIPVVHRPPEDHLHGGALTVLESVRSLCKAKYRSC